MRRPTALVVLVPLAAAGAVASAGAAGAAPAACAPSITVLPVPAGATSSELTAAAGSWAIGRVTDSTGTTTNALWHRNASGTWALRQPGAYGTGLQHVTAVDVNAAGQILLQGQSATGLVNIVRTGSTNLRLRFPGGRHGDADGLGSDGAVAGSGGTAIVDTVIHWAPGSATGTTIGQPHAVDATDFQVDPAGKIALTQSFFNVPQSNAAFADARRPRMDLQLIDDAYALDSRVRDMNDSGRVVGSLQGRYGDPHAVGLTAFYADGTTPVALPLPAGRSEAAAAGISPRGDIVGTSYAGTAPERVALWFAGQATPRTLLPATRSLADVARGQAIGDDGTVYGVSATSPGAASTFVTVWTCARQQSFVAPVGA